MFRYKIVRSLQNEIFSSFELNKKICSKKYLICSKLRWSDIFGNLGSIKEERFIPHSLGMKKAYFPTPLRIEKVIHHLPHSSRKKL